MHRACLFLLIFASMLWGQSPLPKDEEKELAVLLKQFTTAYHVVEENFADPVSPEQALYGGAIPGLLRTLDPFSSFLDPDQFRAFQQMQQSVQKGFGSVVSVSPGRVIVLQTLPSTPSARAGLAAGDEIVEINGYRLDWMEPDALMDFLRQTRQNQARLMVRRPGVATLMPFLLTPAEVASPSVSRAFFLRPGVGYIKIESFEEKTAEEFRKALDKLGTEKLRGLVLDLRDNPGGVLPAAIEVAAAFLKPGQVVLSIRGRSGPGEAIKAPEGSQPLGFPLAVLVNGRSASAAEIVAWALEDHDRATIVGEPSFGKGLVQRVFPLPESTALALTTALYFTPSGRSIQKSLAQLHRPMPERGGSPIAAAGGGAASASGEYRTDAGRPVKGGGGITPDVLVSPEGLTPFRTALETSSSFLKFAQRYTADRRSIPQDFDVTPELLDDFQAFLSERQIRPALSEWSANREYIRNRLKTEIFNLTFGVEKGDEVEAQRDRQVQKALEALDLR
ncbi:MAG: S41 family peptidase [Acidobacteria bacterium]|nr:S41 family peptidase [Acidobacteriota bacterium]